MLFDEPLSNLDARLRDQVRAQLHELHARLRFSAVFVTHDQSEALALADRVAIMRAGRFEQVGTPEHVFEEPATEYVAGFIGMSNRLPLVRDEAGWAFAGEAAERRRSACRATRRSVAVRLRPEDLHARPDGRRLPDGLPCPSRPRSSTRSSAAATWTSSSRSATSRLARPGAEQRRSVAGPASSSSTSPSCVGFDPASAVYYGDDDTRLAGHVDLASPRRGRGLSHGHRPRRPDRAAAARWPRPPWLSRALPRARRARLPRSASPTSC